MFYNLIEYMLQIYVYLYLDVKDEAFLHHQYFLALLDPIIKGILSQNKIYYSIFILFEAKIFCTQLGSAAVK